MTFFIYLLVLHTLYEIKISYIPSLCASTSTDLNSSDSVSMTLKLGFSVEETKICLIDFLLNMNLKKDLSLLTFHQGDI